MDSTLFKHTFLPLAQKLYAAALRITGHRESAEDLVQDTYLKLWQRRNQVGDVERPDAFALTTLQHVYVDGLRRRRPDVAVEVEQMPAIDPAADPQRAAELADQASRLRQIIDSLAEPARTIVTMRDIHGMGYDEIAALTHLSEGNIRVHLSRARKKIREMWRE